MLEAFGVRPGRKLGAAQMGELFLEADIVDTGVGIARGDWAADAGVTAFEIDFADAETDDAAQLGAEELIFPEGRDSVDFECSAETETGVGGSEAGEPAGDGVERGRGDDGRAVGDEVVGDAVGIVADHDVLLEKLAEPFAGGFGFAGKSEGAWRKVGAMWRGGERDGGKIGRVGGADAVQGRVAAKGYHATVAGVESPGAIEVEAAGGADGGGGDFDGVEGFYRVNLDAGQARSWGRGH